MLWTTRLWVLLEQPFMDNPVDNRQSSDYPMRERPCKRNGFTELPSPTRSSVKARHPDWRGGVGGIIIIVIINFLFITLTCKPGMV